jgi:hypothetical protein
VTLKEALNACDPLSFDDHRAHEDNEIRMAVSVPNGKLVAVQINGEILIRNVATIRPKDNSYLSDADGNWQLTDEKAEFLIWRPA